MGNLSSQPSSAPKTAHNHSAGPISSNTVFKLNFGGNSSASNAAPADSQILNKTSAPAVFKYNIPKLCGDKLPDAVVSNKAEENKSA